MTVDICTAVRFIEITLSGSNQTHNIIIPLWTTYYLLRLYNLLQYTDDYSNVRYNNIYTY